MVAVFGFALMATGLIASWSDTPYAQNASGNLIAAGIICFCMDLCTDKIVKAIKNSSTCVHDKTKHATIPPTDVTK